VLHKEIPFLRISLPLCLGIISGLFFHPGNKIIIILLLVALSLFIISSFSLTVSFIFLGNLLYNNEISRLSTLESKESIFLCSLTDYPEEKENTLSITVKLLKAYSGKEAIPLNGYLLLYHRKTDSLNNIKPGDFLIIKCTPVETANRGNPCEFDYRFYLQNRGIKYYAFTDNSSILKTGSPAVRTIRNKSFIIRKRIVDMFEERGIKGERLALVAAITLGQRNLLDPETKLNFSKAGAMHIMAVSGLNAGILSMFIFNILFFMKGRLRIIRSIITIIIIWLFAFITGLSPSVERATLMFSFIQAGKLINRQVNDTNSVLASAFVMMLIQPSVIFDTGFQLSYVAVLFIIGYYEDLHSKMVINLKLPELVWQAIVVTVIAQAGTLALTIMSFNRFPVYFLLTNIFVVPISSFMIIIACLVLITFPLPFLSLIFAKILDLMTLITQESTRIIASMQYSSIDNIGMSTLQCILLTIFIALILYWLLKEDSFSIHLPLIFLISFVATGSAIYMENKRSNELIVYNSQGTYTVGIRTGNKLNIFRKDLTIPPEVIRHCAVNGFKIDPDTLVNGKILFKINTNKILICNGITNNDSSFCDTDIMILTGKHPKFGDKINSDKLPKQIIITSEADLNYFLPWSSNTKKPKVYYVRKDGAITISI
jgi:competence protein ComEC